MKISRTDLLKYGRYSISRVVIDYNGVNHSEYVLEIDGWTVERGSLEYVLGWFIFHTDVK